MDAEYVTRREHAEFAERIKEEDNRQNKRIAKLEDSVEKIEDLASSVKVLAVNMDNMAKELAKQGLKLDAIESKPAQNWEKLAWAVGGAIIVAIIGLVLKQVGL